MIRGTHLPDWSPNQPPQGRNPVLDRIKAIQGLGAKKLPTNESVGLPPEAPNTLVNAIRKTMHRRAGR